MRIKCKNCEREFTDEPNDYPGKVYVHKGEYLCENCVVGMGALPEHKESQHLKLITDYPWFFVRPY